jgi:peptidoglycan-associated lipoprotein
MTRWIAVTAIVGLLVGCSSTPTKEQEGAKVEERQPQATQVTPPPKAREVTPPPAATSRVPEERVSTNPLKDPNNILSKRSVYFDYDSNTVKDEFKPMVSAHGKYLAEHRTAHVTIQGNTDERGSREYNLALGQRRADAVKQLMTLSGAPASQIETVSFGEEKPRATGSDEQAFAENRRADIVYQGE